MYVCMYVSVTLRNPIISCATRKHSVTCASVTLRNVTAVPAIEDRGEKSSVYNYSAGRALILESVIWYTVLVCCLEFGVVWYSGAENVLHQQE